LADNVLLIVESAAKAKTLSKFLGKGYKVKASIGHVKDLPKSKLGIDINNNYQPEYITIRGKGEILKDIKEESQKAKRILLATDPDREGEAIAWHLQNAIKITPGSKCRIEFHEITKEAVKNAIKNSRPVNMDKVNAQQARRVLDRLVGYNLSPLLWAKVRKGLSAGRVQSVAIRLICEREEEIRNFISEEYWTIESVLANNTNQTFKARLLNFKNEKIVISNEKEKDRVVGELRDSVFQVVSQEIKEKRKKPSAPFITSSLQQEASKRLNFYSKRTMKVAQELYEGLEIGEEGTVGLITYLRTDSTRVSQVAQAEALEFIRSQYGDAYAPAAANEYKTKKNSQDAHEAIRPTSAYRTPESIKSYLSRDQYRLYKLIWERFIASQMTPAVYVGGAVERPGVYRLPLGSRVYQAIEMAGGAFFLDPRYLDMARKLVDEETIFVPTREEIEAGIGSQLTLTYYGQADKLNINTASAQEIAANLSGIGPVLAERIVEYRNKNGSFKSIDEIKKVNGIGEGRFEEIKDHISVR
jgi:DNA topoisomerase-1